MNRRWLTFLLIGGTCFAGDLDTIVYRGKPLAELGPESHLQQSFSPNGIYLGYFPDEGSCLLPSDDGSISLLLAAGKDSWLFTGGNPYTMTSFTSWKRVMEPDPNSAWENGYAGMSGVWINSQGKIWGFYHAEDHVNLPLIAGTQIAGFYASIGVATSVDTGQTWQNRQQVITSSKAKVTGAGARTDQGAGEPGVVPSPDGKFLFVDFSDHNRINGAGVQIVLTRIPIIADSLQLDQCRKWDGTDFTGACLGGKDVPVLTGIQIMGHNGDAIEGHPTWSDYLQRYLMPVGAYDYSGNGVTLGLGGLWLMASEDMIHWTDPQRIFADWSTVIPGKSLRWEASLVWTKPIVGKGWLIYGQTDAWPDEDGNGEGAQMAGRPFQLLMGRDDIPESLHSKGSSPVLQKGYVRFDLKGRLVVPASASE